MRPILHVISGLRTGGAETMLVSLCRSLTARGLPQAVVALTAGGATVASWLHGGHARNSPAGVACHESSPVAQATHTERAGVAQG